MQRTWNWYDTFVVAVALGIAFLAGAAALAFFLAGFVITAVGVVYNFNRYYRAR